MIEAVYNRFLESAGVSIDSRDNLKDKIFIALKGEKTDGNQYWKQALDNGAIACIVSDADLRNEPGCYYFEDTLKVLQDLAGLYKKNVLRIPTLGITGSNGKTTTKELLVQVMSTKYKVHATKGNFNNHIGLPLTVLSCPKDAGFLILEMGANAPGDIKLLCEIGQPTHGLITSIGTAHLQGFGDLEGIIRTKFELFNYLDETGGICFINRFDSNIINHRNKRSSDVCWGESLKMQNGVLLDLLSSSPFVIFRLTYPDNTTADRTTKLTGLHNWYNVINTYLVGNYFGLTPEQIGDSVSHFIPNNNRSQWVKYGRATVFLDAYNANPSSVRAVLSEFVRLDTTLDKYIILGAMGELGEQSIALHREILEEVLRSDQFAAVFLVGQAYSDIVAAGQYDNVSAFPDVQGLRMSLGAGFFEHPGVILVKGSRSIGLERLFDSGLFESVENIS